MSTTNGANVAPLPTAPAAQVNPYDQTSVDELVELFKDRLEKFRFDWLQLGLMLKSLETRGAGHRIRLDRNMRWIMLSLACGQMVAGLMEFGLGINRLRLLASYPLPDQQQLVDKKQVLVVELNERGTADVRMLGIGEVFENDDLFRQVFSRQGVRNEQQQIAWLSSEKTQKVLAAHAEAKRIGQFIVDKEIGDITFDGKRGDKVSVAELKRILRALG